MKSAMCRPATPDSPAARSRPARSSPAMRPIEGRAAGTPLSSDARRRPVRIELVQELEAAFGFVLLADRRSDPLQARKRPQEPAVLRMGPTDVARPAPAVLT